MVSVLDLLRSNRLLPPDAGCLVAVSGGADSVFLARTLAAARPDLIGPLALAHFHHHLRGSDADADAEWVAGLARELDVPCVQGEADVRAIAQGDSLEATARRCRHAFLADSARRLGFQHIALGHQSDDRIEGWAIRWLRGAGPRGLRGLTPIAPSPAQPDLTLIRPLLHLSREAIRQACRELHWNWRDDASNHDPQPLRNRVRLELLPFLRSRFQPGLDAVWERMAQLIGDQAEAVTAWADSWLAAPERPAFDTLPVAVQREIVCRQLERLQCPPHFTLIEHLRTTPGHPISTTPTQAYLRQPGGQVVPVPVTSPLPPFQSEQVVLPLLGDRGHFEFAQLQVDWERLDQPGDLRPPAETPSSPSLPSGGVEYLDAEVVGRHIVLRHWEPGDRFHPIGAPGPVRVQDLFTHARVPVGERRRRVLAATGHGDLFWIEGLRLGALARLQPTTRLRLRWSWKRTD